MAVFGLLANIVRQDHGLTVDNHLYPRMKLEGFNVMRLQADLGRVWRRRKERYYHKRDKGGGSHGNRGYQEFLLAQPFLRLFFLYLALWQLFLKSSLRR